MRNILSVLVTVPIDKLFISNIVTAYLIKYSPIYIYIYIYFTIEFFGKIKGAYNKP